MGLLRRLKTGLGPSQLPGQAQAPGGRHRLPLSLRQHCEHRWRVFLRGLPFLIPPCSKVLILGFFVNRSRLSTAPPIAFLLDLSWQCLQLQS
jgi:hypothetical protein